MSGRSNSPGFVGRDAKLVSILRRVNALNQELSIVRAALPPELARLCLGVAWSGTSLLVAVPYSAAAARLRLSAPMLLSALRNAGVHATAILPRVQVVLQVEKPKQTKQLTLPVVAKEAFSDLAHNLENDELREAVLTLLRHHRQC